MKVTFVNHTKDGIVVHRPGCADIAREERKGMVNSQWTVELPDHIPVLTACVNEMNASFGWTEQGEEPQPWHMQDIRVMPCVK